MSGLADYLRAQANDLESFDTSIADASLSRQALRQWASEVEAACRSLRAGAAVPPDLTDDALKELAYSAHEEAMSFGLSHETFLRYFKTIRNRAALSAAPVMLPERTPAPITFYESDGTERRLTWEHGDRSVGIQDGYTPDDNAWEEHALSAAPGSPVNGEEKDAQRYRWLRDRFRSHWATYKGDVVVAAYPTVAIPIKEVYGKYGDPKPVIDIDAAIDAAMSASTTQTQEPRNAN